MYLLACVSSVDVSVGILVDEYREREALPYTRSNVLMVRVGVLNLWTVG